MEAESNHKYDTTDYTRIDPAFGDDQVMRSLCRQAHERGIRIMVDAVFNLSLIHISSYYGKVCSSLRGKQKGIRGSCGKGEDVFQQILLDG